MTRVRPKHVRVRLDPDQYDSLPSKCCVATAGDANRVAQCPILRFTTKNFAASLAMIRSRT